MWQSNEYGLNGYSMYNTVREVAEEYHTEVLFSQEMCWYQQGGTTDGFSM